MTSPTPRSRTRADFVATSSGAAVENRTPFRWLPDSSTNLQGDEVFPLSGKPYFHVVLSKSHLKPNYQMGPLNNLDLILPSSMVPTVLTYRGKSWEMIYNGQSIGCKRFDSGWRSFANDNYLKVGDACIFELMECSSGKIIFRVQILREVNLLGLETTFQRWFRVRGLGFVPAATC